MKRPYLKLLPLAVLCATAVPAQADSIVLNRAVVATGQTLSASIMVDQARANDVYLGVRDEGGNYFFINKSGAIVPYVAGQPTPSVLSAPAPGIYNVVNMQIPAGLSGQFNAWLVRGTANVDILAAVKSAKGGAKVRGATTPDDDLSDDVDLDSIDPVLVQVNLDDNVTGDLDDNGFPDDDLDLNGIPDDNVADDIGDDLVDDSVDDGTNDGSGSGTDDGSGSGSGTDDGSGSGSGDDSGTDD